MNQSPNEGAKTFLYIIGIALGVGLLLAAFVLLLTGLGVIQQIPSAVVWAIVLFSIGIGILSGLTIRL